MKVCVSTPYRENAIVNIFRAVIAMAQLQWYYTPLYLAHWEHTAAQISLAGSEISADVHAALSGEWLQPLIANGKLCMLDPFITDDEKPVLFATADIIWIGHKCLYGDSGAPVQAAVLVALC